MRITREMMLKVPSDAVARQTRSTRGLLAAYLCGSLLEEDYLLGGTGDIDLVYIYTEPVAAPREIVSLAPVHLVPVRVVLHVRAVDGHVDEVVHREAAPELASIRL